MSFYSDLLGTWKLHPTPQMQADLEMAEKQAAGTDPGSPESSFLLAVRSMIEASLPDLQLSAEGLTMVVGPDQRHLATSVLHQGDTSVVLAVVDDDGNCGQAMLQMDEQDSAVLVIEGIDDEALRFSRKA
jgi:hypothetical protein